MADPIKIAVRVRPFSEREKARGAKRVVHMEAQTTSLINPENPKEAPKKFTFDFSYWSHDGYKLDSTGYCEPEKPNYVDQGQLFEDLGLPMLKNAWSGYNCSIFAYGQTGSGKSYSIMGHGPNKGLVPRVCERLFHDLASKNEKDMSYQVQFSMLEIYNERIRDLLQKKSKVASGALQIKESPDKGFFVEGLSILPVESFNDIRQRMQEGERQRTIAATKMNATSSRAHTLVEIRLDQNKKKKKITKQSSINLVDLAGSERVKQTESTGDRFKEAKNINKSLLTLGNVIKALCDQVKYGKKYTPSYRDSVLTKLLKNALGGNSKTVMVAAISPDAENYEQTLSTLRYADRAKSIKTTAKVNETATDKLISDLIHDKERLLAQLKNAKLGDEEIKHMEEQEAEIRWYKDKLQDFEAIWQRRVEEARKEMEETMKREKQDEDRRKREEKKLPHFANLNEDPALTGKLIHIIREDRVRVGNGKDGSQPEIILNGPRIAKDHAEVLSQKGQLHLHPLQGLVLHNGTELTENKDVILVHNDRIRFGSNNLFVFLNPKEAEQLRKTGKPLIEITYDFAQDEIVEHSGINIEGDDVLLREEVMSMMQLVGDVNAMAEDMGKPVSFNIELVSAEALGFESGRPKVYVRLHDESNDNEYLWDRNTFLGRQNYMQAVYESFEENGKLPEVSKENDPFLEPADTPVQVGVASVSLKYLSHLLKFDEEAFCLYNYRAEQIGYLYMNILPCDSKGEENEDLFVAEPMDMLQVKSGLRFKVKIMSSVLHQPRRYKKTWCRYQFYNASDYTETDQTTKKDVHYNHAKIFHFKKVDDKFVNYLLEKSLPVEVWGQQFDNAANAGRQRREKRQRLQEQVDDLQEKMDKIQLVVSKNPKSAEMVKIKKILDN